MTESAWSDLSVQDLARWPDGDEAVLVRLWHDDARVKPLSSYSNLSVGGAPILYVMAVMGLPIEWREVDG